MTQASSSVPDWNKRVMAMPGMTTLQERTALFEWGRDRWSGFGSIVDLGSWLGSLIAAMAEGVRHRPGAKPPWPTIHAYERFQYEPWMEQEFARLALPIPAKIGDSFEALFWQLIEPWKEQVTLYPGDILQKKWIGGPIEILIVDVMKSWELAEYTLREFFPYLVPGKSWLMHQDFTHFATPWVSFSMYRLRDYFEVVGAVPESGSLFFKLQRAIPLVELERAGDWASYSRQEADDALAWAEEIGCPTRRGELVAARVIHEIDAGRRVEMAEMIDRMLRRGITPSRFQDRIIERAIQIYPSMTHNTENLALLDWVRQDDQVGGRLVDLGTGLGGSAVALAEGLRQRRPADLASRKVEVFDLFLFEDWMRDYFDLYQLPVPQAGESYRSLFDSLTKPWGDRLVTVEGNARAAEPGTESIALLVIDLVYFWEQGADILQRFLPLLREPGSLLVGREFLSPTIGLLPALLVGVRDRLRVRSKFGDTVWFEVVEPMPESITWPTFLWELPNESVESAVSWCASIAPERGDRWPLLVRGALEMMSERFDSAADVLQQIYASPVRDDAYLRRMVDRFVEKLLYRLEWDAAVREEMGWAEPPLQERAGSPREAIWQSFLRFKAWRMGEACEPIHYTVGSEDSTEENRIALAWREVMALARGIDWPGNTWVRLADA